MIPLYREHPPAPRPSLAPLPLWRAARLPAGSTTDSDRRQDQRRRAVGSAAALMTRSVPAPGSPAVPGPAGLDRQARIDPFHPARVLLNHQSPICCGRYRLGSGSMPARHTGAGSRLCSARCQLGPARHARLTLRSVPAPGSTRSAYTPFGAGSPLGSAPLDACSTRSGRLDTLGLPSARCLLPGPSPGSIR